jgi:hypothetical protein
LKTITKTRSCIQNHQVTNSNTIILGDTTKNSPQNQFKTTTTTTIITIAIEYWTQKVQTYLSQFVSSQKSTSLARACKKEISGLHNVVFHLVSHLEEWTHILAGSHILSTIGVDIRASSANAAACIIVA